MSTVAMEVRAERERTRNLREICGIMYAHCSFCGQEISVGGGGHTTFERLVSGKGMCHGKPKGRRTFGFSITKPGQVHGNTHRMLSFERYRYADVIAEMTAEMRATGKGYVRREVEA